MMTSCSTASEIQALCLRLLARREYSQRELLDKLAAKGFRRSDSQPVLDRLVDNGWQSDQRYAEQYARQRIAKGYGPLRIRYDLQQHGIHELDLDALAQDVAGGWLKLLETVYRRKYGDELPADVAARVQCSRFLQQRGFSRDLIRALFQLLAS